MLNHAIRISFTIACISFTLAEMAMWYAAFFKPELWACGIYTFMMFVVSFASFIYCSLKKAERSTVYVRERREPDAIKFKSKGN